MSLERRSRNSLQSRTVLPPKQISNKEPLNSNSSFSNEKFMTNQPNSFPYTSKCNIFTYMFYYKYNVLHIVSVQQMHRHTEKIIKSDAILPKMILVCQKILYIFRT